MVLKSSSWSHFQQVQWRFFFLVLTRPHLHHPAAGNPPATNSRIIFQIKIIYLCRIWTKGSCSRSLFFFVWMNKSCSQCERERERVCTWWVGCLHSASIDEKEKIRQRRRRRRRDSWPRSCLHMFLHVLYSVTSVSVCSTRTSLLIIGLHSPAGQQQPAATPLMFSWEQTNSSGQTLRSTFHPDNTTLVWLLLKSFSVPLCSGLSGHGAANRESQHVV